MKLIWKVCKGTCSVYIEVWSADELQFLKLKHCKLYVFPLQVQPTWTLICALVGYMSCLWHCK